MKKYQKLGVPTVEDLLRHAPRNYLDLRRPAAIREVPVPEGPVALPKPEHPALELFLHRGKNAAKLTADLFFGSGWTSRPTQCKLALLTNPEETQKRFSKLARTVISRAAEDMRQRSYYR